MKTKRIVSALLFTGLAITATASQADGLRFFPGLDADFKYEPTLAITGGVMHVDSAKDNAQGVYGLEFSMNCGLFQTPDNRIRTHLQVNRTNESNAKATSFELSPRYTLPLGSGFSVGVGPALALVMADNGRDDRNLFGYGVAAGANFRKGAYYSGIDARYLNTAERNNVEFENWALIAKIGVNF